MVVVGTAFGDGGSYGRIWDASWTRGQGFSAVCVVRAAVIQFLFLFDEIGGEIDPCECVYDQKGLRTQISVSVVKYFI